MEIIYHDVEIVFLGTLEYFLMHIRLFYDASNMTIICVF